MQTFQHGEISWSPNQGPRMVVALYAQGNRTTVDWGSTLPFNYQYFIVLWKLNDRNVDQRDVANPGQANAPLNQRDHGVFSTSHGTPGRYTFIVEGCDGQFLSSASCRQGWTVPVSVAVPQAAPPPPPPPPPPPGPPPPGPYDMERFELFNCTPEHRPLSLWVTDESAGHTDRLGPVPPNYNASGTCPAGEPFDVNFTDQHVYTIVTVDPAAIGCGADDPGIQACRKKAWGLRGRAGAGTKQFYVP